jgi:hypothetical protein
MSRSFKLQPVVLAAYLAAGVAAYGASYSYKNFVAGAQIVLPSIKALAPTESGVILRAVRPHITPGEHGNVVSGVLRAQFKESEMIHREWVKHTELKQELLRNQMLLWLVALVASVGVVACLHFGRVRNAL